MVNFCLACGRGSVQFLYGNVRKMYGTYRKLCGSCTESVRKLYGNCTESFFGFLVGTLRGIDPSRKTRDVGMSLVHPCSRQQLRYVSEHAGFRV